MLSSVPWLVSGERVLASVEVMETRRARRRGLLGRESLDGAVVLMPARAVHTIGMKFPIDVVFCRRNPNPPALDTHTTPGTTPEPVISCDVIKIVTMDRNRVGLPRPTAHAVVEMPAGACERLEIHVGDQLEVRPADSTPSTAGGPA